ncbi:MAG: two-component sensor histidine kinase [Desulfobacterales bacterium]|nr:two-component sensor histidine kinase [Desulfobacterales bacterium]
MPLKIKQFLNIHLIPIWKSNLLVFGLLIIIVLSYFYWQLQLAHKTFINHAREHSKMLTQMIELNARGAVMSQEVVEKIMLTFLGHSAKFVDYLDAVETFMPEELAEFSLEAGLAGICIIGNNNEAACGPKDWFEFDIGDNACIESTDSLLHLHERHLYYLIWARKHKTGCIIVGLTAADIEKLHEQVGLPHLLNKLSDFSGIKYVRVETENHDMIKKSDAPEVILIENHHEKIAETRISFGQGTMVVALEAKYFFIRVRQLWNEFFLFSAILAGSGVFFSWLLYRYQTAYLNRIRDIERELARQREDAALGRAASSITHEIRNPLNAISMGLQRLQIEAGNLSEDEYMELVATMLKAVKRTNNIVADMRRFTKPLKPRQQNVSLDSTVNSILGLYRQKCIEQGIVTTFEVKSEAGITGDPELLEQVVENLVKNSIEAQPDQGHISITLDTGNSEAVLSIENRGFTLSPGEAEHILEPYFTTKTRGTGLGLAIAGRIITAHGGKLKIQVPIPGTLKISVYLPLAM